LLFSDRGLMKFLEVFRTHRNLEQEIHRLEQRNEELRRGVEALKNDPDTIESIARRELGLVKEGELVYQFRRDTEP
jgi:cell division protein FtsB